MDSSTVASVTTSAEGSSRRTVLAGAGVLGAVALTGCGSRQRAATTAQPLAAKPTSSQAPLAQLADIPVGGAIAATDAAGKPVILSQPTAGVVRCFSALCTHKGCTVKPAGIRLHCPCHKSNFDPATGAVITGPATLPLPEVAVVVVRGAVVPA